jgi:hypothetical protein
MIHVAMLESLTVADELYRYLIQIQYADKDLHCL